jgi:hypothetical protein
MSPPWFCHPAEPSGAPAGGGGCTRAARTALARPRGCHRPYRRMVANGVGNSSCGGPVTVVLLVLARYLRRRCGGPVAAGRPRPGGAGKATRSGRRLPGSHSGGTCGGGGASPPPALSASAWCPLTACIIHSLTVSYIHTCMPCCRIHRGGREYFTRENTTFKRRCT